MWSIHFFFCAKEIVIPAVPKGNIHIAFGGSDGSLLKTFTESIAILSENTISECFGFLGIKGFCRAALDFSVKDTINFFNRPNGRYQFGICSRMIRDIIGHFKIGMLLLFKPFFNFMPGCSDFVITDLMQIPIFFILNLCGKGTVEGSYYRGNTFLQFLNGSVEVTCPCELVMKDIFFKAFLHFIGSDDNCANRRMDIVQGISFVE